MSTLKRNNVGLVFLIIFLVTVVNIKEKRVAIINGQTIGTVEPLVRILKVEKRYSENSVKVLR